MSDDDEKLLLKRNKEKRRSMQDVDEKKSFQKIKKINDIMKYWPNKVFI